MGYYWYYLINYNTYVEILTINGRLDIEELKGSL